MKSILTFTLLMLCITLFAQENTQWRGKNRDGIYEETGLNKLWSEEGPKLLWHFDGLGVGHASAAVTSNFVYTAGTIEGEGFIIAFDHSGNEKWRTPYGKEWVENFDGVRSTPTIDNGKLYFVSAYGNLICLNAENGEKIWGVDILKDYDGRNIQWGITESLLVDDTKVYCTPGGVEANVIALDKTNGKLIWKSAANGEKSAYCSPVIINHKGKKIFVTMTADNIIGLNPETGKMLWKNEQTNKWSVHANTPIYKDGLLYCVSGYGKGGVMLKLSDDGTSVTEVWRNSSLDSKMSGVVVYNNKIHGSGDANKKWFILDWNTGEQLGEWKEMKPGVIIFADEMFYIYSDDGEMAQLSPNEGEYDLIASFKIPYGEKQHWAHPVIHDKKLYVRHGGSLMVYSLVAE